MKKVKLTLPKVIAATVPQLDRKKDVMKHLPVLIVDNKLTTIDGVERQDTVHAATMIARRYRLQLLATLRRKAKGKK